MTDSVCYRFAEHDDYENVLLPDHPPEVRQCLARRPLSCYYTLIIVSANHRSVSENAAG